MFFGQMKLRMSFLAANILLQTEIQNNPMCKENVLQYLYCFGSNSLLEILDILFIDAIMDSSKSHSSFAWSFKRHCHVAGHAHFQSLTVSLARDAGCRFATIEINEIMLLFIVAEGVNKA